MADSLAFSVVVVWRLEREPIHKCLRSLFDQVEAVGGGGEVIVATAQPDRIKSAIARTFPRARWAVTFEPMREATAWEAGLSAARGRAVAFAHARCDYSPGWAEATVGALTRADCVAAGPVEPAPGTSLAGLAAYLCDYGAFADPAGPGRPLAASNNIAFVRSALATEAQRSGFDKTALLASGMFQLAWVPAMRATQNSCPSFRAACVERFARGRHYASWRSARWPQLWRWGAGAGCPALPALLGARLLASTHLRRHYAAPLLLGAPWVVASLATWSLGEMAGYLAGDD